MQNNNAWYMPHHKWKFYVFNIDKIGGFLLGKIGQTTGQVDLSNPRTNFRKVSFTKRAIQFGLLFCISNWISNWGKGLKYGGKSFVWFIQHDHDLLREIRNEKYETNHCLLLRGKWVCRLSYCPLHFPTQTAVKEASSIKLAKAQLCIWLNFWKIILVKIFNGYFWGYL